MKKILLFSALLLLTGSACTQNSEKRKSSTDNSGPDNEIIHVGGSCEGCEAVYESEAPFETFSNTLTLPDYNEEGPKLEISGVIYKKDGITPASDVVLYLYHTDQNGYYSKKGGEKGWGLRHGYIRGWLKTNDKGEYKFFTLKPAPYPNAEFPAHIHAIIKEPDKNPYWIDDYVFEDDKFVDEKYRNMAGDKGGSGIIALTKNDNSTYTGTRNLILGMNITDYPK